MSELAKLLADKLYVFALTITEEDARKRFIDRVRKLQLRKNRETMLKDAMSVYPISMQAFDRNKYFFNCKNGTLDMRTLEFREHRPEDYLTMESGITYDPDADCPRWHSFIKEVMCGDADLADFLQRSLGYALTGDTSQECMFILYGATSRNGKGTAMETFLKIMGDYAIGVVQPVGVSVECFGTEHQSLDFIEAYVHDSYDLTPQGIIKRLGLLDVDYNKVSAYGHFGKAGLPWEE